ncbi:MAG: hypothetical protein AB7F35_10595 [Acetobacteraceae bacterium]
MAKNPLDEFLEPSRRVTLRPEATRTEPAVEKPPYKAFDPVDRRQLRVWICPRLRAWEALPYNRLDRIVTDGTYGTRLGLIWGFAVVVIHGRNLQELARALAQERCDQLQEFDPARFEQPTDPNAAYIERIDIHVESREDMLQAAEEAAGAIRQ